jgi:MerR family transcriptional regulator, redox-sensitive transcriptional activator SoxR
MQKRTRRASDAGTGDLTIGEVARQTGLRTSALRYYESVGVLPPPRRVNGRRRFGPEVVRLLSTVRFAQNAGFTVAEIRTLFHGFGAHVPPSARWRQLANQKLAELDALVARAEQMKKALHLAMECGCVRMEDCELDPDGRYAIASPTPLRRATPGRARVARVAARARK